MKRDFRGKVAVVTGAGGGIGREIVKELLHRGAKVVAVDINPGLLKRLRENLGRYGALYTYRIDITDFNSVKDLAGNVHREVGKVSYIFNNAGAVHRSLFVETKVEVFKKVVDVNLWGSTYITKVFINDVIENRGAIEVTASVAAFAPLYGRTFYAASKYALRGLFETLRSELKETGVTVTIVAPGFTKTPFEQAAMGPDGSRLKRPRKKVGKYLKPEKVARKIVKSVERNKKFVVLSTVGKLSYLFTRCCPSLYEFLMYKSVKGEFEG